jgi:hypothetical protein|tara:strand:+ start:1125 stop:1331 length:207 start_codon:yes stop_codon:yes gene_type:complete
MVEKADIVAIDNDEDNLAIVWKLIPDTDLVIIQKFNTSELNRSFLSSNRLTVIQSAADARKRGRNKIN